MLAGEQTLDEIVLNPLAWYAQHGIALHLGKKVVDIDRRHRVVRAEDGTEAEYDRLLMATGSTPFMLPVPGEDLDGVIAYRDIADTRGDDRGGGEVPACGRHRRRPARTGGGQRADAARHAGHRGARRCPG